MAAASVTLRGNSIEVLTRDNYETWSVLMENYLRGEDLWDVIDKEKLKSSHIYRDDWMIVNAKALYAIQLSCGPDFYKKISKITYAREAWKCLRELLSSDVKDDPDVDLGIGYNVLHQLVEMGNWNSVRSIITKNRDAMFEKSPSGKTVLHVAVIAGHERIVEKLVKTLERRLLEMRDNDGYKALAFVAQLNGNTKMAKCMVEKNEELLNMETNDKEIPLLLASNRGHTELARYLYSKTPIQSRYSLALGFFQLVS